MTPKHVQTPEQLHTLAECIHDFLKQKVEITEIEMVVERGHELAAYMANTGKMLADARYHRDEALKNSILKQVGSKLPASTLNELVKAQCKDENYLVNFIEQLDKEVKYSLEWLRSVLSKEKEQMRLISYSSGARS